MAKMMINCPKTGKPLFTGMDMPAEMLANGLLNVSDATVGPCPHCGGTHVFQTSDIFAEGDSESGS